jgi:hypothetical protein
MSMVLYFILYEIKCPVEYRKRSPYRLVSVSHLDEFHENQFEYDIFHENQFEDGCHIYKALHGVLILLYSYCVLPA